MRLIVIILLAAASSISITLSDLFGQEVQTAPAPRHLTTNSFLLNRGYQACTIEDSTKSPWLIADLTMAGGVHTSFLIDTGASKAFLNQRATKRLGLKPSASYEVDIQFDIAERIAFKSPLLDMSSGMSRDLDGIIGVDTLLRLKAVIDYRSPSMHILPAKNAIIAKDVNNGFHCSERREAAMILDKKMGKMYIDVMIENHSVRLLLDSGASRNLLFASTARKLGYKPVGETNYFTFLGGLKIKTFQSFAPRCSFQNEANCSVVPFVLAEDTPEAVLAGLERFDECDGFAGSEFFCQHSLLMDFGTEKLFYQRPVSETSETEVEGEWQIKSSHSDPQLFGANGNGAKMIFRGNKMRHFDGTKWSEYVVLLNLFRSPKWIDFMSADNESMFSGRYELSNDECRIAFSSSRAMGRERPASIKSDVQLSHYVITLARVRR